MTRKFWLLTLSIALASASGCCRMCCWQRGGSWYNGYCYPQMPPLQAAPQAPVQQVAPPAYAQPCVCQ